MTPGHMSYEGFQIYHARGLFDVFTMINESLFSGMSEPDKFIEFCYDNTSSFKPKDYNETLIEHYNSPTDNSQ